MVEQEPKPARSPSSPWFPLWIAFFLAILIWKWNFITRPPFEDQAVGAWSEASFLAETGFDYMRLRYDESNFMEGGAHRSYMISIQPTIIAGFLRIFGPAAAIVLMHLSMFALAATLAVQIISLLRPRTGMLPATIVAVAMLSTPAMAVPIETLGMELPLLVPILVAIQANVRGQYVLAALFGFLAFLCKASGLISLFASVTLLGIWLLLAILGFLHLDSLRIRRMAAGLAGNMLGIVAAFLLMKWSGDPVVSLPAYGWPSIMSLHYLPLWSPDLAVLMYVAGLGTVVATARMIEHAAPTTPIGSHGKPVAEYLWQHAGAVNAWIGVAGFTFAIARYYFLVRYFLPVVVMVYLVLGWIFLAPSTIKRWSVAGFLALIVFNMSNQQGEWYFSVHDIGRQAFRKTHFWNERMGAFTERSGEYRAHHEAMMALVESIDHLPRETPIFCDKLFSILLRNRWLGYVDEPFTNVCDVETSRFEEVVDRFREAVWRSAGDAPPVMIWSRMSCTRVPPPSYVSTIIHRDELEPSIVAYRLEVGRFPKNDRLIEDEYLRATWSKDVAIERLQERFEFYKKTGRDRELLPIARETLVSTPADDVRRELLKETVRSLSRSTASSERSSGE